jgi:hypothetical protein
MLRSISCFAMILAVGFLSGCGGGAKPEVIPPLEPVSGTVTLDGKPTGGIAVTFMPTGSGKGNPSTATTDESGKYSLKHRSGKDGIPQGDYIVLFSKLAQPDGSPIPPGKTAADVGAVEQLPQEYRQMDNLTNGCAVPKGGKTDANFDLKTQ